MAQPTIRSPQVYRPGLWSRMAEGLRYGGGIGQWSWLLHRLTGVGILVYLVAHITDTFFVVVNPAWYDHALAMYGGEVGGSYFWPLRWAFRLMELGLIASVLFHAVNGVRIVLFDLWPGAALHQRGLFRAVAIIFFAIMIPVTVWVVLPLGKPPIVRPEQQESAAEGRVADAPGR